MPQLIEHVDAIARQLGRDILYLEFHPPGQWRGYRCQDDQARAETLAWLDRHAIGWQPCGPFADPPNLLPWLGQVALDLPYDAALPRYALLRDHLEFPDGSMRQPGVRFHVMPLAYAMRNAAHDAPGFAETGWEMF